MLQLAQGYYHDPTLAASVLKNSPDSSVAETETSLLAALQSGQIDYLAIYKSDALEQHLKYIALPPQINLSDSAGGEPLLRRGLAGLVAAAAALRPRPEISLTINGIGLARLAAPVRAAQARVRGALAV